MKNLNNSTIRYFLITERDSMNGNMLFPPMCGVSLPIASYLGRYPQSMEHYALGTDYYSAILRNQINAGYFFNVVYTDNFQEQIESIYQYDGIQLFFISVSSEMEAKKLSRLLLKNHKSNIFYQPINMPSSEFEAIPNYINHHDDFLNILYENSSIYLPQSLLTEIQPFCVPISAGEIKRDCFFMPTRLNMFTSQCIWGNWGAPLVDDDMTDEQSKRVVDTEKRKALINAQSFIRQQIFVRQISEVDFALKILYETESIPNPGLGVPLFPPLIMTAPFNSPLLKKMYGVKKEDEVGARKIKKVICKILETEQTPNYIQDIVPDEIEDELMGVMPLGESYFKRRMYFLDNAGYLHSSIKFSPYVRLPVVGKSIYSQLSTVGHNTGRQLIVRGKVRKIHKKVKEIGGILANKLLSPELQKTIKNRDSQIVAISDVPIEWLHIDEVPLGFSHDVCRIPETPNGGILAQYMSSKYLPMEVSEDILSKTLVVFGATEGPFAVWQQVVVELSQALGFKICICSSVAQLKEQMNAYKPHLLVIDSHGDVDEEEMSSYLMLGKEKLTGDDVVKEGIIAPLIFLSACSTAPTYTPINIIANAFFEAGAKAVTSSYLPLGISTSSVTYIRLLHQLSECSRKSIHCNWLSFISHILRTSYVMQPYTKARDEGKLKDFEKTHEQSNFMAESMIFNKRRKVYHKIQDGIDIGDVKYSTNDVSPEYLFYSNLGRSDLIYFSSWKKEYQKRVENNLKK